MTELEWLACNDPERLRRFQFEGLGEHTNRTIRQCQLFGVACCEAVRHLLMDERSRQSLDVLARHAEDPYSVTPEAEETVKELAFDGLGAPTPREPSVESAAWAVVNVSQGLVGHAAMQVALALSPGVDRRTGPTSQANEVLASLFRDIFGNPFRPVAADPAWLTSTVVGLAAGIYADRAFDRLPVLADALMDAGCDHPDVLAHCRSAGPHVRGCWVIDLLTGRA